MIPEIFVLRSIPWILLAYSLKKMEDVVNKIVTNNKKFGTWPLKGEFNV